MNELPVPPPVPPRPPALARPPLPPSASPPPLPTMPKQRKRWPWLVAAAGAAAVIAAIVCLVPSRDERRAGFLVKHMRTVDRHNWSARLADIPVDDDNRDGPTFRQAFEALGPKAVPVLLQALEGSCDDQELEVIFAALKKNGPGAAAAVPYLTSILEDPSPMSHYLKMQVIETLSTMGAAAEPALPAVAAFCEQDHVAHFDSDKDKLAATLARFGERIIPHMIKLMARGSFQGRGIAYRTVGKIGAPALPRMILLLKNQDPWFHRYAADCLMYMNPQPAPAGMLDSIYHDPDADRAQDDHIFWLRARQLAKSIVAAGAPAVESTTVLLEDEDWRLRALGAHTLGQIGPPAKAALPALEKCRMNALEKEERDTVDEAINKIRRRLW